MKKRNYKKSTFMERLKQGKVSRREFIRLSSQASALNLGLGGLLTSPFYFRSHPVFAEALPQQRKFCQIFLSGGWDSALATDPVIGSKVQSASYEPVYKSLASGAVAGKENLIVGQGLLHARPAFAAMNTCFVNGLFVEVTAHDLASRYLLTGRVTLSRSANYPAFIASMAQGRGHFPAHAVFGDNLPLGNTEATAPPFRGHDVDSIAHLLRKPFHWAQSGMGDLAIETTQKLNAMRFGTSAGEEQRALSAWLTSENRAPEIYSSDISSQITMTEEQKLRYAVGDSSHGRGLASAYMVLKSGFAPFVTTFMGQYDTHSDHLDPHRKELEDFSDKLKLFVEDLRATPDPDQPSLSLADTTTILIFSEFVRTPLFNANEGTDHWQSASAIVMGPDVIDNQVIGRTDDQAAAMGWVDGQAFQKSTDTNLGPENLASAIVRYMGFDEEGESLGPTLLGVFSK